MNKKELAKNMLANIVAFALNTIVSFFLTSYIVENVGDVAYGFVKLTNDFTGYASLITIALNSMSARYIMISLNRDEKEAIKYYNSVIIANIILSGFLLVPSAVVVLTCNSWLSIPAGLLMDVRWNFVLVFLNFLLSLIFTTTGEVFYLTNKLYISSCINMNSVILRTVTIIVLFWVDKARISYIALASLIATIFVIVSNLYYKNNLLPNLKLDTKKFEWKKIKNLLSSGIWNSITKLSQLFTSGLDLLIANIFVDAKSMGVLSVAKTIPNMIVSFICSIANIFNPNLTQLYAQEKQEELKTAVKSSMRIMSLFVSIPNAILITIGIPFYQLWVPSQPARTIQILAILTVINSVVTGILQPIYSVFTITNRVKENSRVMIIYGIFSILTTLIVLKTTNLGVYAIAGVSLFGSLIVALGYHLPMGAKYLGLSKKTFVPEVLQSIFSFILLLIIGYGVSLVFDAGKSWLSWFITAGIIGVIGLFTNSLIVLKKSERMMLIEKCKKIVRRKA